MVELDRRYALKRAGLYIGFIASFTFMVFIANYQLDHLGRYTMMLLLIPLPFIFLFIGWKKPIIGGILLIIIGTVSIFMETNVTIGVAQYIPGRGFSYAFSYTLFFVTLPLLASGVLFLFSGREQ
ncbi:hypothetical protein ACFLY3_03965 [Chloroflexota bacterium]